MDLADKIIASNDSNNEPFKVDEFGLPIPETVNQDYIVARILSQKRIFYKLHGDLYVDGELIKPSISNIVWLNNGADKYISGKNITIIWKRLLECVHEFERKYIRITNELIWNRETAEIEYWYNRYKKGK